LYIITFYSKFGMPIYKFTVSVFNNYHSMRISFTLFFIMILISSCPKSTKKLVGDYKPLSGISIESNSNIVSIQNEIFSQKDTGKTMIIHGAGTGTDGIVGDELVSRIKSYVSPTKVILYKKASNTVKKITGGIGTDNTPILKTFIESNAVNNIKIKLPEKGNFLFGSTIHLKNISNLTINGKGSTFSFISGNPNSYIAGTETKKDLFRLFQCSDVHFENFEAVNIGQSIARKNKNNEGGYWSLLNGQKKTYNRHFNKQANTGAVVRAQECKNIELLNIQSFNTGCLFATIPGANFNANRGGYIKKCSVYGWGQTAVYPVHNMLIEKNIFNNKSAPVLSSDDIHKNLGTSHVVYSTSGYGNIKVIDNQLLHCRGTAIQFNTKDKDACLDNVIAGNTFIECARNGSMYGYSRPMEVVIKNNTYKNCGRWEIGQPNIKITFENEKVTGEPSNNNDFRGFLSFTRVKKLTVKNCEFKGVVQKGNVAVIQMSSHSGKNNGLINIEGCYFDSKNNRAFLHLLDHVDFSGKLFIKKNKIDSEIRFVGLYGAPSKVSKNGKYKFFIEENTFGGSNSNQIVARFGISMKKNKHFLKNKQYALELDMLPGAGETMINACQFINNGGSNPIRLTPSAANNKMIKVEYCKFRGTGVIDKNGNTLKSDIGNLKN
jgi:hypothetical protein